MERVLCEYWGFVCVCVCVCVCMCVCVFYLLEIDCQLLGLLSSSLIFFQITHVHFYDQKKKISEMIWEINNVEMEEIRVT